MGVSFSDWLGYDIIRAKFDYILRAQWSAEAFRFSSTENVYYNAEDVKLRQHEEALQPRSRACVVRAEEMFRLPNHDLRNGI